MDGIKISAAKFETMVMNTVDHVWCGILKRRFKLKKNTYSEWKAIIESLKNEPAK